MALAIVAALGFVLAGSPAAAAGPAEPVRYVVGLEQLPAVAHVGERYHGERIIDRNTAIRFVVVEARTPHLFVERARRDPNVRYVEEDPIRQMIHPVASSPAPANRAADLLPIPAVEPVAEPAPRDAGPLFAPNDPRWNDQYGPQQIRADLAWDTTLGSTDAAVCVLDTGVRRSHEDIGPARWLGWRDFINNNTTPYDDNGHGTHVAGIAAATINNARGIAGIGNVGIYGVKVLNWAGSGSWSGVANGITWCADNTIPRTVLNLSLGGSSGSSVLLDAVRYAANTRGRLVVAASGNGTCSNCVTFPARYAEVVAVTCTTSSESSCGFTSRGPEAELAAPGQSILSTWAQSDTSYRTESGTSMSAPHVAGAAALTWSHHTGLSAAQVRQRARDTAKDLGPAGHDSTFGYGRVDALCLIRGQPYPCAGASTPTAPQDPAAAAGPGAGQITVSWQPPGSDGGSPLTGYRLYRAGASGGPYSLIATLSASTLSHTDGGLGDGATRFYRVSALNSAGEGPQSLAVSATTFTPPSEPRNLSASPGAGGNAISLAWQPPLSDGGATITGYRIYRSSTSGGPYSHVATVGSSSLSYTDTGLPSGVTRFYRVSALNVAGEGPRSNEAGATTGAGPPSAPQDLAATAGPGAGEITLSWTAPESDGGSPITGYQVIRASTPGGPYEPVAVTPAATLTYTDAGLGEGTTRYYRVRATNDAGDGPLSDEASTTTFMAPSAPLDLLGAAGPGNGEVNLGWQPPAFDGGSPVSAYRVERAPVPAGPYTPIASVSGATFAYTDSGLGDGVRHTYRVRAVNIVGAGTQSNAATVTTFDVPSVPRDVRADPGPDAGEITLRWEAPESDGGRPILGYRIEAADESAGPYTTLASVDADARTYRESGLDTGVTRFYRVRATNAVGDGPASGTVSARTLVAPSAPTALRAEPGTGVGTITLGWSAPPDAATAPVGTYLVYRATEPGGPFTLIGVTPETVTGFTDSGLTAARAYYYRVSAANAAGEGAPSGVSCTRASPWPALLPLC